MKGSLLPELPYEIRAARIGTCYNPILRSLMPRKIAIDANRLPDKEINFVSHDGKLLLRANSTTSSNTEETYMAMSSKLKYGNWVNLDFNMSLASAQARNSNSMNCYCSYIFKGQKLELLDMKGKTEALFNYMTDDFQKAYTELVNAPPPEVLKKYFDFINDYGYGCITELYLTSGSAFELHAAHNGQAQANESKYHAGIAVGGSWGGVSVAGDFAKKMAESDSTATIEINAVNLPENAPTSSWCNSLLTALANLEFSKFASGQGPSITPPSVSPPATPAIPTGSPSKKKLPEGKVQDFSEELKKKLMKDDGFNGTWDEYKKVQKDMYDKLNNPKKFISELNKNRDELLKSTTYIQEPVSGKNEYKLPEESFGAPGGWDLGGYVPYAFEYTPWNKLFPKLSNIPAFSGFSILYLAKSYVYYMTRLQFASYLSLLADIDARITENPVADIDADNYLKLCEELRANISKQMSDSGGSFQEKDYNRIVAGFENKISAMRSSEFNSKKIYELFYEHHDFFIDNLCGFAGVYDQLGFYRYVKSKGSITDPVKTITLTELLKEGLRYYFVVTPSGGHKLACINSRIAGRWSEAWTIKGGANAIRHIDRQGLSHYEWTNTNKNYGPTYMYGIGGATLNFMNGSTIAGLPMVQNFDFKSILDFANPDNIIQSDEFESYRDLSDSEYEYAYCEADELQ